MYFLQPRCAVLRFVLYDSAVEFCDVLRLSEIDFKALCETHPDFHSEYEEMVEVVKAEKRLEQMDDRY